MTQLPRQLVMRDACNVIPVWSTGSAISCTVHTRRHHNVRNQSAGPTRDGWRKRWKDSLPSIFARVDRRSTTNNRRVIPEKRRPVLGSAPSQRGKTQPHKPAPGARPPSTSPARRATATSGHNPAREEIFLCGPTSLPRGSLNVMPAATWKFSRTSENHAEYCTNCLSFSLSLFFLRSHRVPDRGRELSKLANKQSAIVSVTAERKNHDLFCAHCSARRQDRRSWASFHHPVFSHGFFVHPSLCHLHN